MKVIFYYIVVLMLLANTGYGQRDSIRVRVFDGSNTPPPTYTNTDDKNYLRFNFYLVPRGAFVFGYERILHPKHALTVDAGITYRDFIYEALNDREFDEEVNVNIGRYFEVAYKFYPKDYQDFDEGIYLSPGFISRSYKLDKNVSVGTLTSQQKNVNLGYNFFDTYLKLGYVQESYWFDNVITDAYIGFGYRTVTSHSYEFVTPISGNGQDLRSTKETKNIPAFYLGARIGFTF